MVNNENYYYYQFCLIIGLLIQNGTLGFLQSFQWVIFQKVVFQFEKFEEFESNSLATLND